MVGFRCPPDVLAKVDKFAEKSSVRISRSVAILHFLERGLAAEGLGRKK